MSVKNEMQEPERVTRRLWEVTYSETNHLVGQISTLLDAMLPDERQAKAAKDIARTLIWDRKNEMDRELERSLLEEMKPGKD